jgi:DNA primase
MKITNSFKSKLKTYFIERLGGFEYKHGWIRIPECPYCHRKDKLGINLSMYRTNCFVCGPHGTPAQIVMDIEQLDTYNDLIKFLNNGDFENLQFTEEKVEIAQRKPVYLPDTFKLISFGTSVVAKAIRNYLRKRGFDITSLTRHGIGYCDGGPLWGYVILPFYYGGHLRYYNARNVLGSGPRYNNPNKDTTGLGKEFIIFNHDALEMYRTVYICEGVFNALTIGDQGIATQGKAFSRYQVNEILRSPANHIIILLDPDAKEYAIKLAMELVDFKKVKVIFLPDNKDVNDLGKNETMKLVHSTNYQSYKDLVKLKNSI